MRRPIPGEPLQLSALDGVVIERPASAREEAVRIANNASFADHWGPTSVSAESWHDHWTSRASRHYASTITLAGDGRVVSYVLCGSWMEQEFYVNAVGTGGKRLDPVTSGGATGRTLLVTVDPELVVAQAVEAGAEEVSAVNDEHGWRLGRVVDPCGHEWEIGHPLGDWPPT